MQIKNVKKLSQVGVVIALPVLLLVALGLSAQLIGQAQAQEDEAETKEFVDYNLILNGDFESGFYVVPELGFEPTDVGNVPFDWEWFRNETYGKYTINNNQGFGLSCPLLTNQALLTETMIVETPVVTSEFLEAFRLEPEEEEEETAPLPFSPPAGGNSLSIHMQSTDQPDAHLGIYQTVNVTKGQTYLFSISSTIQVQIGGTAPDINHRVRLAFDHTGGTDWRAIPEKEWIILPLREQELEFELSGPDDPDLAKVESYYYAVEARSDRMTIFINSWRRWPNWRTGIFTFDCVSLVAVDKVDVPAVIPFVSELSTTSVDTILEASAQVQPESAPVAEPAAVPAEESSTAPAADTAAAEPAVVPDSGGILETKGNSLLFVVASVIVISGLVGAGIWNIHRQKQRADNE